MIRMGNKKSDTSDAPDIQSSYPQSTQSTSTPAPLYSNEPINTASKPSTDSENIARDIKDGKLSGFVGHGTSLTGDTSFQMMLRVDGQLTGTVSSDGGTLIVGNNGQLDANVSVGIAQINGTVNGDISATDKIQLGRTARVVGNIATPKLIIEDGALFEGGCTMLKARESSEKQTTATTSTPSYGSSSSSSSTSSYGSSSSTGSSYSSTSSAAKTPADDDDDALSSSKDSKTETAKV
ncbi:MAG TPA: polymer-forming cytoskeletal protein [Pyrinomonadaceae bacterium]|nr:polymer-forming cytoskeletal protein [Pyrinomonadaceae bacterium]